MMAIQAAPTGTSASATKAGIRAVAITAVAAALTSIATVISVGLPIRARTRGITSAPATAPMPTAPRSIPYPAEPRCRLPAATSGSNAQTALAAGMNSSAR
jgi:hypothetical protein